MHKTNELLNEIVHVASQAIIVDDLAVKRQALGDLQAMIREATGDIGSTLGLLDSDGEGRAQTPAAPQGLAKFLTVHDGVTLVRFKGKDDTRLLARRIGRQGNPNTVFEICINHKFDFASIRRDDRMLFQIQGNTVGHNIVEKLAVSALHRYLKDQRPAKSKRRRAAKLRAAQETKGE